MQLEFEARDDAGGVSLRGGEYVRCPPKDESRRTINIPNFLHGLLSGHRDSKRPQPCACHDLRYTFSGNKAANKTPLLGTVTMKYVAAKAGVSVGTVSNVLNRPEIVEESTRNTVTEVMEQLGYNRGATHRAASAHWHRNSFAAWVFQPAATGWYPAKAPAKARPVPVLAEGWPGLPRAGPQRGRPL